MANHTNSGIAQPLPVVPDEYVIKFFNLLKKLEFSNERATIKLKKIYKFMDEFSEFVATFTVCSRGCSYCCQYDVSITDLEAKYIEENSSFKRNTDKRSPSRGHRERCSFLGEDNACSIYGVRPFHCRTYHALDDPVFCKTNQEHRVFGSNKGEYTVPFYAKFSEIIHYLNKNNPVLDIRDFYPEGVYKTNPG